jgi:hypothetical protein
VAGYALAMQVYTPYTLSVAMWALNGVSIGRLLIPAVLPLPQTGSSWQGLVLRRGTIRTHLLELWAVAALLAPVAERRPLQALIIGAVVDAAVDPLRSPSGGGRRSKRCIGAPTTSSRDAGRL